MMKVRSWCAVRRFGRPGGSRVAAGVVLAAVLGPVAADDVSLVPAKDNTLFETVDGSLSSGAGAFLFCGRSGGQIGDPIQHRLVIAFDLSSIPSGSTITSATLTLTMILASPFGGQDNMTLYRLLADWGEGTSDSPGGMGAPATPGDATWLHTFFPDQFWATAGGDFTATISSSQTVGTTLGEYTWGSTPHMVADVQAWLDDPASNYGWIMIGNEVDLFAAKKFFSREGDAASVPTLIVEFDLPQCPWDCDGNNDGNVNVTDLLALLGQYDPDAPLNCTGGACDYDNNGCVDVMDLLKLLAHYTTDPGGIGCPQ